MNQFTTIAALPSGAGCKSALPAEVGEAGPAVAAEEPQHIDPNDEAALTRAGMQEVARAKKAREN